MSDQTFISLSMLFAITFVLLPHTSPLRIIHMPTSAIPSQNVVPETHQAMQNYLSIFFLELLLFAFPFSGSSSLCLASDSTIRVS